MKQQTHKTQEQLKYDTHAILHLNKHQRFYLTMNDLKKWTNQQNES